MTISQIVKAAAKHHMTYGEYVRQFDPPGPTKDPPKRYCNRCGCDTSGDYRYSKYCLSCAEIVEQENQEKQRQRAARNRKKTVRG